MTKEQFFKKITSRKFIVALICIVAGVSVLLGADRQTVETVAGGAMIVIPSIIYCITEGKIDAENAKAITSAISSTVDDLEAIKKGREDADDQG